MGLTKCSEIIVASLLASNLVRCCRLDLDLATARTVRVVAWWLAGCECSRNEQNDGFAGLVFEPVSVVHTTRAN